ncbi:hypothetical protein DRP05_06440 [Archaeoglobales archaeon]|nr:MAG: hypothetical protein DRP05_06440 [Archaeoglobales archaeon]
MKCVICGEEEADGKYEEFGICPICGDIIDDVIAFCFKELEKSDAVNLSDYFNKKISHINELASWMWGWIMGEDVEAAKGADERYFKRLELVVRWMQSNPDVLEKICDKYFCKCECCGMDLTPVTIEIKEEYGWFKVMCKKCRKLIAKCFSPKEI